MCFSTILVSSSLRVRTCDCWLVHTKERWAESVTSRSRKLRVSVPHPSLSSSATASMDPRSLLEESCPADWTDKQLWRKQEINIYDVMPVRSSVLLCQLSLLTWAKQQCFLFFSPVALVSLSGGLSTSGVFSKEKSAFGFLAQLIKAQARNQSLVLISFVVLGCNLSVHCFTHLWNENK